MSEVSQYHNPQFNSLRQQAHNFATHDLGLRVAPLNNIAVITPDQAKQIGARQGDSWHGGYDLNNNTALVMRKSDPATPYTTNVLNTSVAVHEIAHSGTATKDRHTFYQEALAGIAERKWLQHLRALGTYRPAFDFMLERAGVRLLVPKGFRYLDAREAYGTPHTGRASLSSQALLAALGVYRTLPKSSLTSNHLLRISNRGGGNAYVAMKQSLEILKPGLSKEVEAQESSTDGIIRATSIIQEEAKKQGLF